MLIEEQVKDRKMSFMVVGHRDGHSDNNKTQTELHEIIYVLQVGEYHKTRNILVTSNAKLIATKYVNELCPTNNHPFIEVWRNKELAGTFYEFEKIDRKVKKAITKIAMGM